MIVFVTLLVLLASIILFVLRWLQERNTYWEKMNVKHLKPKLLFGNSFEAFVGAKHTAEIIENAYLKYPDEDVVGYYEYVMPALIVRKPKLIEKILIKDFSHFTDRLPSAGPLTNPQTANLVNMCGKQWYAFRTKLSPLFSSGKLKYMFGPLADCGTNLTAILDSNIEKDVDINEIMNLFSMDVIGSCAFGIDPGALQNPSSTFRAMGKKMFDLDVTQYFRFILMSIAPKIAHKFQITFVKTHVIKYFCDIIYGTLDFRKKNNIERPDFIQMLMKLKESGKIEMQIQDNADEYLRMDNLNDSYEIIISDELLLGTAFGFLSAGFHTTASTLTYALYELAQQPDILYKVRREVKDQVAVHGDITFDALKCMTFLEKVLKETMRLHPAVLYITRVCTKEYKLPSGLILKPGDRVIIPTYALHRDPFLHEDSYSFKPSRFDSPVEICSYLPFGEGPRTCIAMRFAVLEMKYAISKILMKYDIQLSRKTRIPVRMKPRRLLNTPKDDVILHIKKA